MIDDSVRLNEAGVIKTRGAHHPLKLDPKEAISRPDMHAYAPFSTLLPHGAMQVRESPPKTIHTFIKSSDDFTHLLFLLFK